MRGKGGFDIIVQPPHSHIAIMCYVLLSVFVSEINLYFHQDVHWYTRQIWPLNLLLQHKKLYYIEFSKILSGWKKLLCWLCLPESS